MAMMKKLTSALVASSLVLGLVGTASATTPDKVQAAAERMAALGLVQGKGGPDLALGDSITRAELVTVIVRAFGQESNSRLLKGVAAFPDTADHWASGYVAMATKLIAERTNGTEVVGMPDGTFKPDAPVTAGEAVAFLMKFTGAPKDNSLPWPDNYLQGALNAGFITAEDLANLQGVKNAPATRGLAFYLADSAFYGYKLAEGSTVYRTFVDTVAPEIAITTEGPVTTIQPKITITGTVSNAESVFIGTPDKVVPVVNGTFTADVDLAMGDNNIVVSAVDLVGNVGTASLKVTRTTGPAVGIAAEDITVAAGETVDVAAAVVDEVGNALDGYTITGESNVGTFADGKFTAGEKAGEGKLVLKAGENGEFTKEIKVTVTAGQLAKVVTESAISAGQPVKLVGTDAYGNPIPGVTFSENDPNAYIDGEYFIAAKEGTYTVQGTLGDITVESIIGAYGKVADLVIEAPEKLVANGESTIEVKVKAVDANGLLVSDFDGYARYDGELTNDADDVVAETADYTIVKMTGGVATFTFKADAYLADEEAESEIAVYEKYEEAKKASVKDKLAEADFTVDVEEQEATSILVETDEYLPVNIIGYQAEVTVTILDQAGVEIADTDEKFDFEVTVKGPAILSDFDDDDGDYTLKTGDSFLIEAEDDDKEGKVTIVVEDKDDELKAGEVTLTAVEAGTPKALRLTANRDSAKAWTEEEGDLDSDERVTYTVQLVDKKGVPTADEDISEVEIDVKGIDKYGVIAYEVKGDDWADKYTVEWADEDTIVLNLDPTLGRAQFRLTSPKVDEIELVAKNDEVKSSDAVKTAFVANDPVTIAFKNDTIEFVGERNAETTVVAQLKDAYGNDAAKAGIEVKAVIKHSSGDLEVNGESLDYKDEVTVVTDKKGQAVFNLVTSRAVTNVTIEIEADVDGEKVTDSVKVVAKNEIANSIRLELWNEDNTERITKVEPGDVVTLRAVVKTNEGEFDDSLTSDDFAVTYNAKDEDVSVDGEWVKTDGYYYTTAKINSEMKQEAKLVFEVEVLNVAKDLTDSRALTVKQPAD